jgi:beta-1,4-mannosyltransferase
MYDECRSNDAFNNDPLSEFTPRVVAFFRTLNSGSQKKFIRSIDMRRTTILVLGDIGRSPRMQYHALSLSRVPNMCVDIVAYVETEPRAELLEADNVHIHEIAVPPRCLRHAPSNRVLYIFFALAKVLLQLCSLLWTLMVRVPRPNVYLVQTPQALPTLACAWLASRFRGARYMIDFHNYAFSLMALSLGSAHVLVRLSHALEGFFARRADVMLTVTDAMRDDLARRWHVDLTRVHVMHDRPPEFFAKLSVDDRHKLFARLERDSDAFRALAERERARRHDDDGGAALVEQTLISVRAAGSRATLKVDRPRVVITSTSWTEDEDISMLLDAVEALDNDDAPRRLLVLITGKGPMRAATEPRLQRMANECRRADVAAVWLAAADYPLLLGAADLGVSLHTSSSGIDLPMKVVDMLGVGLPVAALDFPALPELVQHERNGIVFGDAEQLASALHASDQQLEALASNARLPSWHQAWHEIVYPLVV